MQVPQKTANHKVNITPNIAGIYQGENVCFEIVKECPGVVGVATHRKQSTHQEQHPSHHRYLEEVEHLDVRREASSGTELFEG